MKSNETRANFNIDKATWSLLKIIVGKYKAVKDGKERQANVSDVLRELIHEYIMENQDKFNELLEEARKLNAKNSTRSILEAWKKMEEEEK